MPNRLIRAALYIPSGVETERWLAAMAAVAETEGWQVASLVRRWDDLVDLLANRLIHIGVIPSRDHLSPTRIPRLVAADEYDPPQLIPGQRRPELRGRPSPGGRPPRPPSTQE